MSIDTEPSAETDIAADVVTVVLDPRVAYVGFGPDDGPLVQATRTYDAEAAMQDLADGAEQLDYAYQQAWERAARRIAPNAAWNVSAPYNQPPEDSAILEAVAKTGRDDRSRADLIAAISEAVRVEVDTMGTDATRWTVIDDGRTVGSATVRHTVMSVQDAAVAATAARLREDGEALRKVTSGHLQLELIEPDGEVLHDPGSLGYVPSDHGAVIFAATDFRPSPLHAIDSDRTVEALAEFLTRRPGDTDSEYFANYTQRRRLWVAERVTAGDGRLAPCPPSRCGTLDRNIARDVHCDDIDAFIPGGGQLAQEPWAVRRPSQCALDDDVLAVGQAPPPNNVGDDYGLMVHQSDQLPCHDRVAVGEAEAELGGEGANRDLVDKDQVLDDIGIDRAPLRRRITSTDSDGLARTRRASRDDRSQAELQRQRFTPQVRLDQPLSNRSSLERSGAGGRNSRQANLPRVEHPTRRRHSDKLGGDFVAKRHRYAARGARSNSNSSRESSP